MPSLQRKTKKCNSLLSFVLTYSSMCIFIYTHKHKYTYLSVYVYIYSFLETLRKSERKVEYFYPNTMLLSKTKTQKQLANIQVWFWTTFCFSCNSRWSFHYGGTLTRGWRGRNTDDSPNMLTM